MQSKKCRKSLFVAALILCFVRALRLTLRYKFHDRSHFENAAATKGTIIALWHEHLFAGITAHINEGFYPMASLSSDGDIVSHILGWLGYFPIRGSSSRGALVARDQMIKILKEGKKAAITIDGPRGPRRVPKLGVIDIAKHGDALIIPLIAVASRSWTFHKSWDKFKLPLPFSRVDVFYAPAMQIPLGTSRKSYGIFRNDLIEAFKALDQRVLCRVSS